MAFNFGPIVYKVTTEGYVQAATAAKSINQNMTQAAAAASRIGKAAQAGLVQTQKGVYGESVAYGNVRGNLSNTGASARDFANQAQGLGGLVRLYATFAANIFAVGAAFEALKRSFQFEQLQKASEAFAITTGKNLGGIAADLKKLSEGTLTDKSAQQMANYGTSAGFTADQMKRMIGVARGASQALGRDMGDAIDRLMRGTGKLEPELLDELGLLTRTKVAGEAYGKTIGKTFEQLTQFEKVQGFINAVLAEGEEKFGAVSKAVQASPFEKFTATILTLGTEFGKILNTVFVPILNFFSENSSALIGLMTLAFIKLLNTALPALTAIGGGARKNAEIQANALKKIQATADEASKGVTKTAIESRRAATAGLLQDSRNNTAYKIEAIQNSKAVAAEMIKTSGVTSRALLDISAKGLASQERINRAIGQFSNVQTDAARKITGFLRQQLVVQSELDDAEKSRLTNVKQMLRYRQQIVNLKDEPNLPQTKYAKTLANRSELRAFTSEALSPLGSIAQQNGIKAAFASLNTTLATTSQRYDLLYRKATIVNTAHKALILTNVYMAGSFAIATSAISTMLAVFSPWLIAIGLVVGLFQGLVAVTGGTNKVLGELTEEQERNAKALKLVIPQLGTFNKLQDKSSESARGFAAAQEYSSNLLSTIAENLQKTGELFKAYTDDSSGWWDSIKQRMLAAFDADVVTEQVSILRKGIFSTLAAVPPSDVEKVKAAIIAALPGANELDDVIKGLKTLSISGLAAFNLRFAENVSAVGTAIKATSLNVTSSVVAWDKLSEAVDKYYDKKSVADPKLKDSVDALKALVANYNSAKTIQERINITAGLTLEKQVAIAKLLEDRIGAAKEFNAFIDGERALKLEIDALDKEALERQREQVKLGAARALASSKELQDVLKLDHITVVGTRKQLPGDVDPSQLTNKAELLSVIGALKDQRIKVQEVINDLIKKSTFSPEEEQLVLGQMKVMFAKLDRKIIEGRKKLSEVARTAGKEEAETLGNTIGGIIGSTIEAFLSDKIPKAVENSLIVSGRIIAAYNRTSLRRKGSAIDKDDEYQAAIELGVIIERLAKDKDTGTKKHHERIAKFYEFRIAAAVAEENQLKKIADIEKSSVGFVDQKTASLIEQQTIKKLDLQLEKQKKEIDIEFSRANAEGEKDANTNKKFALDAAKDKYKTDKETAALQTITNNLLREKVEYEVLTKLASEEQLSIANQILGLERQLGSISELDYTSNIAINNLLKEKVSITEKQKALDERRLNLEKALGGAKPSEQQAAILSAQQAQITTELKRANITADISIELGKQKEYWDKITLVEEGANQVLKIQLVSSTKFISLQQQIELGVIAENNLLLQGAKILKDKIAAAGVLADSVDAEIIKQGSILELTNKVYEMRVKMAQLAAKDGSGADIIKSIGQAFQIEYTKFADNTKGFVEQTVASVTSGIDAAVDYLVLKVKDGTRFNPQEFIKAAQVALRGSISGWLGDQLKLGFRKLLTDLFPKDPNLDLATIQKQVAAQLEINSKAIDSRNDVMASLISALKSLEDAITVKLGTIPGVKIPGVASDEFDIADTFSEYTNDLGDDLDDIGNDFEALGVITKEHTAVVKEASIGVIGFLRNLTAFLPEGVAQVVNTGLNFVETASRVWNGAKTAVDFIGSTATTVGGWLGIGPAAAVTTTAAEALGGGGALLAANGAPLAAAGFNFAPLLAAAPYLIAGAVAVYALVTYLNSKKGGPKTEGGAAGTLNPDGSISSQSVSRTIGNGQGASTLLDSQMSIVIGGVTKGVQQGLSALGGTIGASLGLQLEGSQDTKGTAPSFIHSLVTSGGQEVYRNRNDNVGRDPEEFAAEIGVETARMTFAALRAADLPQNVSDYFDEVTNDVLKTMSAEDLAKKFDFAGVLATINNNRAKITETFGQDLYNLIESDLQTLALEGETFSQTFERLGQEFTITNQIVKLFGLDTTTVFGAVGLASTQARERLIAVAGGIDELSAKTNYFLENFYTETERNAMKLASATETLTFGFGALNQEIPKTKEEYQKAVADALKAGNFVLYNTLLELAPAWVEVDSAINTVIENSKDLVTAFALVGVAISEGLTAALTEAGIDVDKFITNLGKFTYSHLPPEAQQGFAVDNANTNINAGFAGSGIEVPTTRAGYVSIVTAALNDPSTEESALKWKDTILGLTDDFDLIFDVEDTAAEAAKKLAEEVTSATEAFDLAGISLSSDLIPGLIEAAGGIQQLTSQLAFYTKEFLTPDQQESFSLNNANTTINSSGLKIIPKTREEFNSLMKTVDDVQLALMLKLAPAFDTIFDVADTAAEAAKKLAEEVISATEALDLAGISLSSDLIPGLIEAAGGIDKLASKLSFYGKEFLSEDQTNSLSVSKAQEDISAGFSNSRFNAPATRAAFVELMNSSDSLTQALLLDLAPAFDVIYDAAENTARSIQDVADALVDAIEQIVGSTQSFMEEIEQTTLSAEERYNKYKGESEAKSKELDNLMLDNDDALANKIKNEGLTPEGIARIASDAVETARKAWDTLTDDQKLVMGPDFLAYIAQLEENAKQVVTRVSAIVKSMIPEEVTVPDTTVSISTRHPTQDVGDIASTRGAESGSSISTRHPTQDVGDIASTRGVGPGSGIRDIQDPIHKAFDTGAVAAGAALTSTFIAGGVEVAAAVIGAFDVVIDNLGDAALNFGIQVSGDIGKTLEDSSRNQQAVFEQQKEALTTLANSLLDAGRMMAQAAAVQVAAANTTQKIEVAVDVNQQGGPSPEVGSTRRRD